MVSGDSGSGSAEKRVDFEVAVEMVVAGVVVLTVKEMMAAGVAAASVVMRRW